MTRSLESLFAPASLAVVGASSDPAKWGHLLARGALVGEHRRSVYLVNRRGGEILGRRVFRALSELPSPPELVVVSVPPAGFEAAVDDALAAGAKAIGGVTGRLCGWGGGGEARRRQARGRGRAPGAGRPRAKTPRRL